MALATHEGAMIHFEKHIIPYLNEHCPFAHQLTAGVWRSYRAHKRSIKPGIAIFNHWKHFIMLYKYAYEEGYLERKITLRQEDRKKRSYSDDDDTDWEDDVAEGGKIISTDHFQLFLKNATSLWVDRATIQRLTGMRPGEVRKLRKNRVNFQTGEINLKRRDTKTGQSGSFVVPPEVLTILKRRKLASNSPFFFPNENDPSRPMTGDYKSWHSAWAAAGIDAGYTPHDLRHSYLTEMFKSNISPALICYEAGLSLEEAQKTYLHFTSEDTICVAEESARRFSLG